MKNELQFFPHPEGYVSVVKFGPETLVINYAYQYKDHFEGGALKNSPVDYFSERARWRGGHRLNYGKDPETNVLKVLEENHYYPFGLKHQNYNTGRKQYGKKEDEITTLQFPGLVLPTEEKPMVYKYKYQSQEFQDELGLNIYFFKFRMSDPATGRFLNIDPLSPTYPHNSTYAFAENNVTSGTDLEGLELSFNLQGDRATAQSGPRVTGGVGGNYTLQELRSHVAQKQAEQDRILQKVMSGDPRSLPKADIHLPASDIRVAKYNNPSLMVADGVGIGAKEAVTDFAVGGILYKLGKGAQSVWKLNRFSRGRMIEDMFGADATWSKNFPTIDKIEKGVATSIKSIDLDAKSYSEGNNLLNTIKGYINKLDDFTSQTWGRTTVTQGQDYTSKALELIVQTGKGTDSQWDQISKAIEYASEKNINFVIRFIN